MELRRLLPLGLVGLFTAQATAEVSGILESHCYKCHSTAEQKGELDLESADIHQDPRLWEHVLEQVEDGEMPPKKEKPLAADEKAALVGWIRNTLDEIALKNAGDPGPVVLRRLSNVEYTHTLQDLSGIPSLDPAREFPVDGAAGEGFTNAGAALVMSPALLTKYLDAAKEVAAHAVFTPTGFRWSDSSQRPDWTAESLSAIREIYDRYTTSIAGAVTVKDGIQLDTGNGSGRLPLDHYLETLQGRRGVEGLSPKYLAILRHALEDSPPSVLLDPLREKFRAGQLTAADIQPWQAALWKFGSIGHSGKAGVAQTWLEPVTPLVTRREHRLKLPANAETQLYFVTGAAGDGAEGDAVVWENARLVAAGRPDIPLRHLPELMQHLEAQRAKIIAHATTSLQALLDAPPQEEPELLHAWRNYLGLNPVILEPLLGGRLTKLDGHEFIRGWSGGNDLSVIANSSDQAVRIPGKMAPHSLSMHPAPDKESISAWVSPVAGSLIVHGNVMRGHPECGSGVTWALEVHRGRTIERLASGVAKNAQPIAFGPFENVQVSPGDCVALIVGPDRGSHTCGLTTVNLTLHDGSSEWDLAREVSPDIHKGNPQGPWRFSSRPVATAMAEQLPAPMAAWRHTPTPELAIQVRQELERHFPLNHPLLNLAVQNFQPTASKGELTTVGESIVEITIPAVFAQAGVELVTTARLRDGAAGSVQTQVVTARPSEPLASLNPKLPVMVGKTGEVRKRFEAGFAEFRELFPETLCYPRIVPVDEVVTLALYFREDDHLRRLMLSDAEAHELDRLWAELLFVSEAPLKQVDALEQLTQYATQGRATPPTEYEALRETFMQAAADFEQQQTALQVVQADAVIEFASRAWRRPLREQEVAALRTLPPRLMLTRVLASPSFLYKIEEIPAQTHSVNDWELATRLSYFLTSSAPDEELREVAARGQLHDPMVLTAQATRLLESPKVSRLATEFGSQWLHTRDVATLDEKSERHFPEFVPLREAMHEEVVRFFTDAFQHNRSVLSLLDADHTFVNGPLAAHYGVPVEGDDWRRVDGLLALGRGGILGFAAPLAKHSGASRTSAILRGTWLSEVLLGDKLPSPPKGVPILPEAPPAGLSERQLIELHTTDPNCASCHQRIDPYGFALEGFDAIGRQREADTHTVLYDGTPIGGLAELREYLLTTRRDDFVRQFCRKLLGYALGRAYQLSDRPLIDSMMKSDLTSAELVRQIVLSRQFREVRGLQEQ
jgi:hypothetical protein